MASPNPAPTAEEAPRPGIRYAYLVARLRNRQITMEEATELFGLMDQTIQGLRASAMMPARMAPSPPPVPPPPPSMPPAVPPVGRRTIDEGDLLAAGMLLLSLGAGLHLAVAERSRRAREPGPGTAASRASAETGTPARTGSG
ncbi:MAG: hypothetical protein QXG65_04270 [Thermoplasmata archaeon]